MADELANDAWNTVFRGVSIRAGRDQNLVFHIRRQLFRNGEVDLGDLLGEKVAWNVVADVARVERVIQALETRGLARVAPSRGGGTARLVVA
jgi:hypothetical protein